jgi:hypothetical protein
MYNRKQVDFEAIRNRVNLQQIMNPETVLFTKFLI